MHYLSDAMYRQMKKNMAIKPFISENLSSLIYFLYVLCVFECVICVACLHIGCVCMHIRMSVCGCLCRISHGCIHCITHICVIHRLVRYVLTMVQLLIQLPV